MGALLGVVAVGGALLMGRLDTRIDNAAFYAKDSPPAQAEAFLRDRFGGSQFFLLFDRLMVRLGAAHPGYGFERHMGYSVPEHFAALERLGPTIHHRRSFAPVAACFAPADAAAEPDPVIPLPL